MTTKKTKTHKIREFRNIIDYWNESVCVCNKS